MKKVKKFLFRLAIAVGCIMIVKWFHNPERKIFSMVQKNQTEYAAAAEEILNGNKVSDINGVDNIHLRIGEHTMVDFFVTGFGLAPSSTYYGFYYSPENIPLPYAERVVLTEYEENAWSWQGGGDNRGVTKKIADGWYYYEASF